ncbi:MmcQ/YjbR family DNA-binding protein [Rhodopseudomonas sp. P2A-2r]|uniref:MmcQ/YjbR family DNA-binding protein n=1 Tax=unclassified Rhodopseudomonas TaxID=2638247 RepID=UPI00223409BC|nr:MmcQ/YjbR family DNA-binding protein [Rhodopseudomonas sp. P2A-2r]UZE49533.1 MmcQ/YjbR family DNA-binding protein [Rhodopseudomonas sp. P2A-2r]
MSDGTTLRRLALALDGVSAAPHFDRTAFKVKRTFATLAADGLSANFKFSPDEQALKCAILSRAFAPVANAWGLQGWTVGILAELNEADLADALEMAWRHALPAPRMRASRPRS